jgi:hypothetical protein
VHWATKHCLQARLKGNVHLRRRSLQKEGDKPTHLTMEEWAALNIAEERTYTMAFERYIC